MSWRGIVCGRGDGRLSGTPFHFYAGVVGASPFHSRPVKIVYPEALPVSRHRQRIREAVAKHQVVIVCGDTGSGKTTQLPKIALELGRGDKGKRIGCTQPRRIAATSVASGVAEELQVSLGAEVGYQIRFDDRTDAARTRVKFMTDGILLAETQGDPSLRGYDTIIVDEAHERSLNIDFILGYLHRLLPRRPDLKVILSSATLDAEAFADFFDGAPVISVEGRTFPVEDRYQVPLDDREHMSDQILRAVEDLAAEDRFGDTLVFLPGEREIRDAADLLEGRKLPDTLVLPLFARLAAKEQQAVFRPIRGRRRIVLATNVAETSLTIPGIRFVIDTGLARISRFDARSGIQRLQVEEISQASARQRRGRCGRVSEGICVRLYDEEDFRERPPFTDPEILRSNLAGVVLQMEDLGLGDPLEFPFVDTPQPKRVSQAYKTLEEIGAIEKRGKRRNLTESGRTIARLPVDPRIGRLLVAAHEEKCIREALIVASALSVQDPRERPQEKQQAADEAHARFRDKRSDFTGWLRWWHGIRSARKKSNNELRRFCKKNFLNYRRTQEWISLHRELRDAIRSLRWTIPKGEIDDPEDTYSEPLHRAILSAIPSHIGLHRGKKKGYRGAGNTDFFLFPGSGVFGASPSWVMAFERVETAKLYARNVASFDPGWMEKVAPHLCRYRYSNPHWVAEQGAVYGEETVVAFGLPVVEKRRIHYARVDRARAREIFILEALVNGNTRAPLPALRENVATLEAAERLEHKLRRLGGLVHPPNVVAFYEERLPRDICTQKDFEKWAVAQPAETLRLAIEDCLVPQGDPIVIEDFPDETMAPDGEVSYPLSYLHNPSEEADGISVRIPLGDLPHLPDWFGEWLVPGWLPEKVGQLLRLLGKEWRTSLPANREVVDAFLDAWEGYEPDCGLLEAVIDFLHDAYALEVGEEAFDLDRMPGYLRLRFEIHDDKGRLIGAGKDLAALREKFAGRVRKRFGEIASGKWERGRVGSWNFGDLPGEVALDRHTSGFPGLYDTGKGEAALKLWPSRECAAYQHRIGVARLFRTVEAETFARLEKELFRGGPAAQAPVKRRKAPVKAAGGGDGFGSLAAAFAESGSPPRRREREEPPAKQAAPAAKAARTATGFLTREQVLLLGQVGRDPSRNRDDLLTAIASRAVGTPSTRAEWDEATAAAKGRLFEIGAGLCEPLGKILDSIERIGGMWEEVKGGYDESIADAREHLDRLLALGWIREDDLARRLVDFQGLEARLTRMLGAPPAKDLAKLDRYREEAAGIWREEASCECGHCLVPVSLAAQRDADCDLRLREFAPELRKRIRR